MPDGHRRGPTGRPDRRRRDRPHPGHDLGGRLRRAGPGGRASGVGRGRRAGGVVGGDRRRRRPAPRVRGRRGRPDGGLLRRRGRRRRSHGRERSPRATAGRRPDPSWAPRPGARSTRCWSSRAGAGAGTPDGCWPPRPRRCGGPGPATGWPGSPSRTRRPAGSTPAPAGSPTARRASWTPAPAPSGRSGSPARSTWSCTPRTRRRKRSSPRPNHRVIAFSAPSRRSPMRTGALPVISIPVIGVCAPARRTRVPEGAYSAIIRGRRAAG